MSALGVKRSWDSFAARPDPLQTIRPTACSPHRIQFLSNDEKQGHAHHTPSHQHNTGSRLPPFHPSSSAPELTWDPHTNSGSIGSKRFRRTEGGDYDIVTVTGEDVHMDTKSPPHSPRSPSHESESHSSHSYRSSREPSVFVQAAAQSPQPFVNLDQMLQHAASTTRTKRQRPQDDQEQQTSPQAKKIATTHHMHQITSTITQTNTSSSSTSTSTTPGVSSLGVFSHPSPSPRSSPPPSSTSTSSQPLFTLTQVRKIVEQALAQQKEQLTQEYDNILNDKLREQFENFSSFNRDYISRQLSKNDFSYLS